VSYYNISKSTLYLAQLLTEHECILKGRVLLSLYHNYLTMVELTKKAQRMFSLKTISRLNNGS